MNSRAAVLFAVLLFSFHPALPAQTPESPFVISTIAGSDPVRDGPAAGGLLDDPRQISVDADNNLYIVDQGHALVRKVTPEGVISTVAGSINAETIGEGIPANELWLVFPQHALPDGNGSLYLSVQARVWRISPDGIVHSFAGTGTLGYGGDGAQAVDAKLDRPHGIAIDRDGNVYIADRNNHRVRKVTADGKISTIAGTGNAGAGGDGSLATLAQLNQPEGVAVNDAGEVFIADTGNHRVRKILLNGTMTTAAGTMAAGASGEGGPATSAGLILPSALAFDKEQRLVIADAIRVLRIEANGTLTKVGGGGTKRGTDADGGPAIEASLSPLGVAVDSHGSIFVAEYDNDRVRKITPNGIISTYTGAAHFAGDGGPATEALLYYPQRVTLDGEGGYYIADTRNNAIRHVDAAGAIRTIAGKGVQGPGGDGGLATAAELNGPFDVQVDQQGNLYISDTGNHKIRKIDTSGKISTVAGTGISGSGGDGGPAVNAQFNEPSGITIDSNGNLYVADISAHNVRRIDPSGTISTFAGTGESGSSGDGGPAAEATLTEPIQVLLDEAEGKAYIADRGAHRVRVVDEAGLITTAFEVPVPFGLARDSDGSFYVANGQIVHVTVDGGIVPVTPERFGFSGDGGPASEARMGLPFGVAIDEQGNLYIPDQAKHRIRLLTAVPAIPEGGLVNAGSFAGTALAPNSIVSLFGYNLADETAQAAVKPLPFTLGGATVTVTDSGGTPRNSQLFFVSRRQINFLIPGETLPGEAAITVTDDEGHNSTIRMEIAPVAPGVFSADASGTGVAAAVALKVDAQGVQSTQLTFEFDAVEGFRPLPVDLGGEGDKVYLTLFGTGIRAQTEVTATAGGEEVPVFFAGEQGEFIGLDQINIGPLPRSLAGAGELPVVLTVNGLPANTVTVTIP